MVIFPYLVSQRTHQVSSKRLDVRECIAKQCPDPRKPEDWSSVSLVPELDWALQTLKDAESQQTEDFRRLPSGELTVCYWKWPSRNRWFPHYKLWFSIVMLVYQRFPICIRSISKLSQITTWKTLWWLHLAMKECNGGFSGTSPCFTRDRATKISKMKMFTNRLLLIIGRLSRHPGFLSLCSTFPFSALPWRRYLSSWNHGLHNRPQVTQMVYLQWI